MVYRIHLQTSRIANLGDPPPGRSLEGENMTLEARAEKIAREVVTTGAAAWYVSATQYQQEKVIQAAVPIVLAELKAFAEELHIKLE